MVLLAQIPDPAGGVAVDGVWWVAGLLASAIALPFVLAVITSFLKLVVVGHIIRSALGTPSLPPTSVITGLAIVLSVHIMAPTVRQAYRRVRSAQARQAPGTPLTPAVLADYIAQAAEPMRAFLVKHAHNDEIALFGRLRTALEAGKPVTTLPATQPTSGPTTQAAARDWTILVPAFVISELSEAFQIGFILFVPFLIIDLVVANVLMSMGMFMLSPVTVSLPIKLLLFVLVDGWRLITEGLVLGYT